MNREDLIKHLPDAKYLPLKDNSKEPILSHGHLEAWDVPPMSTNWGISLEEKYLVVDFDAETHGRIRYERDCFDTWTQATPRTEGNGRHYLFTVPANTSFEKLKANLYDDAGVKIADIKVGGYIVGPGSKIESGAYRLLNNRPPTVAPEWALKLVVGQGNRQKTVSKSDVEFDQLPDGQRDNAMHQVASLLRRIGWSRDGIQTLLQAMLTSGAVEQPEGREMEDKDAARLARSVAQSYSTEPSLSLASEGIKFMNSQSLIRPPREWALYKFIPAHALSLMYGKGGIGKTTFAAWLIAEQTKQKKKCLCLIVEEEIEKFTMRVVLNGGDRAYVAAMVVPASQVTVPRDVEVLSKIVEESKIDFIYFDSIYTHFGDTTDSNSAERARKVLSPLSEMAQNLRVTVLGNFHENKAGIYLGSTEMENVSRSLLKLSRLGKDPLRVEVEKTNFDMPEYDLFFPGEKVEMKDPLTGEIQMEKMPDGTLIPEQIMIALPPTKTIKEAKEELKAIDSENLEEEDASLEELRLEARDLREEGYSFGDISKILGKSKSMIHKWCVGLPTPK